MKHSPARLTEGLGLPGRLAVTPAKDVLILICERRRRWTTALRLAWKPDDQTKEPVRLRSPRLLAERVKTFPASFVFLETELEEFSGRLAMIRYFRTHYRSSRLIALVPGLPSLPPGIAENLRFALLDGGAVHVLGMLREIPSVVPILEKHFADVAAPSRTA